VRELELKSLEEGRTSSEWESHLHQCTFAEDFFGSSFPRRTLYNYVGKV
jgi:hypothetical protein